MLMPYYLVLIDDLYQNESNYLEYKIYLSNDLIYDINYNLRNRYTISKILFFSFIKVL